MMVLKSVYSCLIVAGPVLTLALGPVCSKPQENRTMTKNPEPRDSSNIDPSSDPAPQEAKATFAAGCFWGVEATFRAKPGVRATSVGYIGGSVEKPNYKQVCTGRTGHAEAVEVIYDPNRITYEQLLEVFWECHDPTTLNRQGPDVGTQYRSAIFVHSPEQQAAAQASLEKLDKSGRYRRPIVTTIEPAPSFYKAEEYHQQYLEKRGQASCHIR
jgi:peptide-methionine (S)-S-oxide reductase